MGQPIVLQVRVKLHARVSELVRGSGGEWIAHVTSPPVDGKANAEVIGLVARHFGCSKSAVTIKSGASGRNKLVRIEAVGSA